MEDKLTGKDFFAVIGILAVAGIIYTLYKVNEKKQKLNNVAGGAIVIEEIIPMTSSENSIYSPVSSSLDGYMELYDTSEANTIGVVPMVINQPSQ
jgi:hypothetical protein